MQNFISISGLEQINPYNILAPDRYMAIFWPWRAQLKHLSKICCKIELKILNDVGAEKIGNSMILFCGFMCKYSCFSYNHNAQYNILG